MKKRWLICLSAITMVLALCFGIVACGDTQADADKARAAIDTVKVLYEDDKTVTNTDYEVFGQVRGEGNTWIDVVWTATSTAVDDIATYVNIGQMDASTRLIKIGIKQSTEKEIPYTLKATVTVGSATESAEFERKISKKSSDSSKTASLDLTAAANRTTFDETNGEQVWSQNGITLTNSGNVADYIPIRLYKNTTVTIKMEDADIIHIDFYSAQGYEDSPYPEYLKTSIESSDLPIKGEVTLSEDGLIISVDFESPLEEVTFKTTAGQCRLTSIDVEGAERDPNAHVHKWTYQHVEGTWTHTATCTAEGCDVKTKTEDCTPKLNVCECGYTYSAKEIVDALLALEKDGSLRGTYSLTGEITAITDAYSTQYKNVTFEMTVDGRTITVYRAKGTLAAEVEVGGTVTVNGELLDYNGTKEFTQGASIVDFTPGVDDRTPQQKVEAALQELEATFTVTKAGATDLPASTVRDVTFTWSTDNQTYPIANNKITVSALPESDATVTATVTAACGNESVTNNTKQVTITIKAQGSAAEGFNPITTPAAGSDYYLAMDINGTWYYSTGTMSSHFLGTTTDISKAAKVTVASSGSGWTLVTNGKFIEIQKVDGYNNIVLADAQTAGQVWMWDADHAVFTMTVGTDTFFMGTYDTYTTFNAAYTSYLESDNEYIGKIGTYSGTVTPPTPSDADASLSFADVANRKSQDANQQVWEQNGIKLTNDKAGSSTDIADNSNPVRLYKGTTVKIEFTSAMAKIVFHCASYQNNDYAGALETALATVDGTVTVAGLDVTLVLTTPATSIEFSNSSAQVRLDSIDVYTTAGGDVGGDTHTCGHVCEICGKCTDESCDDPVCAEKCEGHTLADTDFPVTDFDTLNAISNPETGKYYYATGIVQSIEEAYNSTLIIVDEAGKTFQIYGLLNEDGTTRYGQNPLVGSILKNGDTIVVFGVLTVYKGTVQMSNAWLVQINDEVKGDQAKLLLSTIVVASPVTEDFDLPTEDGKIVWTVSSGSGISVSGGKATVTRSTEDQTVVLKATATVGTASASKDFTVVVTKKIEGQESVTLTVDTLNIPSGAYTNSGSATVGGVSFSWIGMGNYGDGLQWRTNNSTGTSTIYNAEVFPGKILKVELVWTKTSKDPATSKTNHLKIELATDANFTDADVQYVTFAADKAPINVDLGSKAYTFIRISHNNQGAVYLDHIEIAYDTTGSSQPVEDADEQKAQSALDAVENTYTVTVAGDYTLPTCSVEGVTFKWEINGESSYTVEDGKLKVGDELPETEQTVSLKLTATCNGKEKSKTVTITINAKSTEPAERTISLTKENLFKDVTGSYAEHDGDYTVEGYTVTTSNVLGGTYVEKGVLQFKASSGTLILGGNFTKITLTILSRYKYASLNKLSVTAKSSVLSDTQETVDVDTGKQDSGNTVYRHVASYTVTGSGVQCITIAHKNSSAYYVESIVLTLGEGATAHVHALGSAAQKDEKVHTYTCDGCGYVKEEGHVYADNSDTNCDKCGYSRTIDTAVWKLVENVNQLQAGAKVVLVYKKSSVVNGGFGTNSYLQSVEGIEFDDAAKTATLPAGAQELTLGGSDGAWTFGIDTETIYVTNTGSNAKMGHMASPTSNHEWTITIASGGAATIKLKDSTASKIYLQYNPSSPRFGNYDGNQQNPLIYVKTTPSA